MCLSENGKSLYCVGAKRHCFDLASSGYVNLSHSSLSGDSKSAVNSRKHFLSSGAYLQFSDYISNKVASHKENAFIADMGCGDGYYSINTLNALPSSLLVGFDLSKYAVEAASKLSRKNSCDDRSLFSVASIFSSPLADNSCDVVLNLFAPCCEKEFSRIMKDDALLIVAGAGKDHLIELKSVLYDTPRENDKRKDLPESLTLIEHSNVKYQFLPTKEERQSLFEMTPYFYRTSELDKERLDHAPAIDITAEFDIYIYKKTTL